MTWTGNVKLVKEALDEWDMREAQEVETPGMTDEYEVQSLLNADLMSKESAAKYRRTAAKLNHLALDHPLIAFASKEACRSMSSPRQGEEVKLKRIMRFLRKRPTTTYLYEWQDHPEEVTGYTDSDWAGCKLTRRSTSGGVSLHGPHLLLHYSRTQAGVALSSAEAELNAALKMGFERELGDNVDMKINGDSSAVKGILPRRGCGKVKHLGLKQLWLQEQVRSGKVEFQKISLSMNPSDTLIHHNTKEGAKKHFKHMSIESIPMSSELAEGGCVNID